MRLLFTVASTGLWPRLTNNSHLNFSRLQPLWGVPGTIQRLSSGLIYGNSLCQGLVVPPWQRILTLILSLTVIRVAGSQLEVHLQVLLPLGRRGAMGDGILDVLQSSTSSPSSGSVLQAGTLPKFWDQWRSITSNRLLLNMVKGHHLHLRC